MRQRFQETLGLSDEEAIFPEYARYAVAMGAAIYAEKTGQETEMDTLAERIRKSLTVAVSSNRLPPLFENREQYDAFHERHAKADVAKRPIETYEGRAYLGIDCGSTTTKMVLLSEEKEILFSYYSSNRGNPAEIVREQLSSIYALCGDRITIAGSAVT